MEADTLQKDKTDIVIRKMKPEEAPTVFKLGVSVFRSMEGLFIGKPKDAVVAIDGEKIIGAVITKKYPYNAANDTTSDDMFGFVDYAFVDRNYHGKGVGNKLYSAAIADLKENGCTQFSALVRGDNPGSFRLFEKMDINRCTLSEAGHVLGLKGMIKLLVSTTFGWGPSMDCYLSGTNKRKDGFIQILWFLLVNTILLTAGIWRYKESFLSVLAASATVLFGVMIFESVIHLIKPRTYHFRLSAGGYFLTALITVLGGYFPLIGKWYPEKFENSWQQRRDMCISSMVGWTSLLATCVLSKVFDNGTEYCNYLHFFSTVIIAFNMLPTYPFCEFSGRRVYQCSKVAYAIMWVVSAAVLAVVNFCLS